MAARFHAPDRRRHRDVRKGERLMIRGKTRHQLFLPDDMSKRLTAMAKSQKRARSDLLLEMVDAYMNRRSAPEAEDRIGARLDRIARAVDKGNNECFVISHSLYRFIRHQLIYAAALPPPGDDAKALGEKRFQGFLDSVAQMFAKGADNDNEPTKTTNEGDR
jgi:predicted transcriptional regulator